MIKICKRSCRSCKAGGKHDILDIAISEVIFPEEDTGDGVNFPIEHIILPEDIEELVGLLDHIDNRLIEGSCEYSLTAHEVIEVLAGDTESEGEGRDGRFHIPFLAIGEEEGDAVIDLLRVMDIDSAPGENFEAAFGILEVFIAVEGNIGFNKFSWIGGLNRGEVEGSLAGFMIKHDRRWLTGMPLEAGAENKNRGVGLV